MSGQVVKMGGTTQTMMSDGKSSRPRSGSKKIRGRHGTVPSSAAGLNPRGGGRILRDPERTGTQSRRRFSLDLGTRNVAAEAGKEKRKEKGVTFSLC